MTTFAQLQRRLDVLEALVLSISEQVRNLGPHNRATPDEVSVQTPRRKTPEESATFALPTQPDTSWIPIIHRNIRPQPGFLPPCQKPALYLTRRFRENERADLDAMRIWDPTQGVWRLPHAQDFPRCASCGLRIEPFSSTDLDYFSVALPDTASTSGREHDRETSGELSGPHTGSAPSPYADAGGPSFSLTGFSPGPAVAVAPTFSPAAPSTFPGHSPRADAQVFNQFQELQRLAQDLQLPPHPPSSPPHQDDAGGSQP